jgi:protein-S-isoprenylcysteine O-methyltransferase Ste14
VRRLWVGLGTLVFRLRDALFPLAFVVLLATTRAQWLGGRRDWDRALDLLGVELALAGQALRALVIGLAYIRRGGKDRSVHADDLVVEGVFAHCRNPLYLGNLISLFGLLVIHNSTLAYLVGVPLFTLAYWSIVTAEEDYLADRFGDAYRAYCARVPRFRISTAGFARTIAALEFDWRRLLRKEYGTTFTGFTAVLATLLWDDYQRLGSAAVDAAMPWVTVAWGQMVLAYWIVRRLKKTGRLGRG